MLLILLDDCASQIGRVCGVGGTIRELGSGCAAVVLCSEKRLLFALSFGDDLLDCLVATLRRFPVGVAKWLVDLVHVELVEESHVCVFVRGCRDGCHVGE